MRDQLFHALFKTSMKARKQGMYRTMDRHLDSHSRVLGLTLNYLDGDAGEFQ